MSTAAKNPDGGVIAGPLSIVCFGASAGGLQAYRAILSLLPADTGMAFIIVHHQPADGKSLLTEILPMVTKMPVVLITDGETVKPDHVYVVPAGQQVTMDGDRFRIAPLFKTAGWPKNISVFLRSLARDREKRAIAVILSGFDSDGAAALKSKGGGRHRDRQGFQDGKAARHARECGEDGMRGLRSFSRSDSERAHADRRRAADLPEFEGRNPLHFLRRSGRLRGTGVMQTRHCL
jgi:chemotaxis response regulator CheB